ncbi:MAG TPA: NAD(P)-dependent oxidoreductase [Sphingomicrobium sp.]|nr:NAD(P)-dependent oxidoreductase [Sphingomicrobium sp.]
MSLDVFSTLEHDPDLGEGTILFGGSGFLGPYILANYPKMISVGRSPSPTPNRHIPIQTLADLSALDGVEFDKVIYIIGNTDHYAMERDVIPAGEPTAFDFHTIPVIQVLEQLKKRNLKKFIHFSSVLIYDEERITLPVSEHSPINPYKNRYVMSKYLGEELCKFYRNWVPIINARFCNLYGPTPLERFDLVHVLTRKLLDEGRAEIWSDRPARDFIYVEDAAHAIAKLLYADYNDTLVLGSGQMTTVAEVVDILREVSGMEIVSLDKPVSGPQQFRADITTLQRVIDWEPRISIREGIRRTWEFEKARRAA